MSKVFEARCELSDAITAAGEYVLLKEKWFAARKVISEKIGALVAAARSEGVAEGAEQERERIRGLSREFKVGDTLIINAPTLLLESSVFHSRRGK